MNIRIFEIYFSFNKEIEYHFIFNLSYYTMSSSPSLKKIAIIGSGNWGSAM
jgi:hypothetical protein